VSILSNVSHKTIEFINTADFGDILAKNLNEQDRSASWLARKIGVHPSTVSKWLSGETRPSDMQILTKIVDVLKLGGKHLIIESLELSSDEEFLRSLVSLRNKASLNDDGVTINLTETPVEIATSLGKLRGTLLGELKIDISSIKELEKDGQLQHYLSVREVS